MIYLFQFFPLNSLTWWLLMDLQVDRASSGRLCLCLQRQSRPHHCKAIIISLYQSQIPWVRLLMDFLGTLSWLNGCVWMVHNPNTYIVYQWQFMCMQVTNANILCSRVTHIENSSRCIGHLQWMVVPIRLW